MTAVATCTLEGGPGDDTLRVNLSDNNGGAVMTGGDGEDRFEVATYPYGTLGAPQAVTIGDYTPVEDKLVLDFRLGQHRNDDQGLPGGLTFANKTH
ncbi:hypothetical protein [Primorskyibacter sp. 2E233]|uniref:hypothetical protein n=1 Tax=Primorskyibacter sp. 2E233 TaxID=3413431 RepID=UPI003BF0551E